MLQNDQQRQKLQQQQQQQQLNGHQNSPMINGAIRPQHQNHQQLKQQLPQQQNLASTHVLQQKHPIQQQEANSLPHNFTGGATGMVKIKYLKQVFTLLPFKDPSTTHCNSNYGCHIQFSDASTTATRYCASTAANADATKASNAIATPSSPYSIQQRPSFAKWN